MRIATVSGRLALLTGPGGAELSHDVAAVSGGRFGPDPHSAYERWDEFVAWADSASWPAGTPLDRGVLNSPVPRPRQVFAIGLNYSEHAREAGFEAPVAEPPVFTKFPSCIVGPQATVTLPPGGHVDWEVELVAVVGRGGFAIPESSALEYLAGYAVGQDLSERRLQMAASPPQFGLAKSLPGFGPIGPWLTTLDEVPDPDDVELGCAIDGETVQSGRTGQLIFGVRDLVARLSRSCALLPGDVIFTGTPPGVGMGRDPQRWLVPGEVLTSWGAGLGDMRHTMVTG